MAITKVVKGRTISLKVTSKTAVTRMVLNVPPKAAKFTAAFVKKYKAKKSQKAFKTTLSITDRDGNHVKPKATPSFAKK